jgi:hypothetical protein
MCDGYDISSICMAAPSLSHAWNVASATFANVFVTSNVVVMVGALASGSTGDRLGRKPVIPASLLLVGEFSLVTAHATTVPMLAFMRMPESPRFQRPRRERTAHLRRTGINPDAAPAARHVDVTAMQQEGRQVPHGDHPRTSRSATEFSPNFLSAKRARA